MSEDRPQYQAERDTVLTNAEIAERLRKLAADMHSIGRDMGRLGEVGYRVLGYRVLGNSMIDRAGVFRTWAHEIEEAQG